VAIDLNWGWNVLLEYFQITITSLIFDPGAITLEDSQLPLLLTFEDVEFGETYTPVTPSPNFDESEFLELDISFNALAEETGTAKFYLGKLSDAYFPPDEEPAQDVLFYAKLVRNLRPEKWEYQATSDGKFYSKSDFTYTLQFWMESDVEEEVVTSISGVTIADSTNSVFPLGSDPVDGFFYYLEATSITEEGWSEFGEIVMTTVPVIKLYSREYESQPSLAVAAWTFEDGQYLTQRWGPRPDITEP
jgi:hypothetical protein